MNKLLMGAVFIPESPKPVRINPNRMDVTIVKIILTYFIMFLGSFSASGQSTFLTYSGYLRGLQVMKLDLSFSFNASSYQLDSNVQTVGFAALAFPRDIRTRTLGNITKNGLKTESFFRIDKNSQTENIIQGDTVQLKNPDGQVINKPRPSEAIGSVDPMSAIGHALWKASQTGRCEDNRSIYDGRLLAKASFVTIGREHLVRDKKQLIPGNALKCRILIQGLEGRASDVPQVDIWMTPLHSAELYIPLKMLWIIDGEQVFFHLNSFR